MRQIKDPVPERTKFAWIFSQPSVQLDYFVYKFMYYQMVKLQKAMSRQREPLEF